MKNLRTVLLMVRLRERVSKARKAKRFVTAYKARKALKLHEELAR